MTTDERTGPAPVHPAPDQAIEGMEGLERLIEDAEREVATRRPRRPEAALALAAAGLALAALLPWSDPDAPRMEVDLMPVPRWWIVGAFGVVAFTVLLGSTRARLRPLAGGLSAIASAAATLAAMAAVTDWPSVPAGPVTALAAAPIAVVVAVAYAWARPGRHVGVEIGRHGRAHTGRVPLSCEAPPTGFEPVLSRLGIPGRRRNSRSC